MHSININDKTKIEAYYYYFIHGIFTNKGNNKIIEHRAIFQRERQNS